MKKKNFMAIVLLLVSILFIPKVFALTLEDVSVINNSDSYKNGNPSITGNGTSNVVITYNAADLKIVPKDPDIGRTIDAAWVGAKVVAPKDVDLTTLKKATYKSGNSESQLFWNSQDTPSGDRETQAKEHYILVYGAITEEHLKQATIADKTITYTWTFDWNNDEEVDQTVTIKINPTGVVLEAEEDDTVLWNFSKYEEVKQANEPKEEVKDNEPKTGDNLTILSLGLITLFFSGLCLKQYEK